MKYLCGCDVGEMQNYRVDFNSTGVRVPIIKDGRLVCPQHGEPIYGWRTEEALAAGKLNRAGGA